jgi:hypothetical protein
MINRTGFPLHLSLIFLLVCGLGGAQTDTSNEQKTATVKGMATNTVSGAPIPHARVRLRRGVGSSAQTYTAVTNEQGWFSMNSIEPGEYFLRAEHRGYELLDWMRGDHGEPKPLKLNAGDEVKDLLLPLVPYAVITGRVLDSNGVPRERVTVEAIKAGQVSWTETDDRGQFRIGELHSGRYLIKASLSGQTWMPPEIRTDGTAEINYGPTYYPSSRTAKSAMAVAARAGAEASGIEIKLIPGPILHVSGTVAPVGKKGRLSVVLGDQLNGPEYTVGPDLKFTIPRLPPGQYQIFAWYLDGPGAEMRSAPEAINLANASIDGIHLVPSVPFELAVQIEIDESSGAKKTEKETKFELRLVPQGSLPLSGPDFEVNGDGSLKITNIFPSRYRVLLDGNRSHDFYVKSVWLGEKEFEDGILDLRGGPGKGMLAARLASDGAEISGVVRDPKGPVAGVEVALFFDDQFGVDIADTVHTQADGSYAFHEIAPGKYKILAYDPTAAGDHWISDGLALYSDVTENIEAHAADKITQDLKFLP